MRLLSVDCQACIVLTINGSICLNENPQPFNCFTNCVFVDGEFDDSFNMIGENFLTVAVNGGCK